MWSGSWRIIIIHANNAMSLFEFNITVCKMKTFDEIDG